MFLNFRRLFTLGNYLLGDLNACKFASIEGDPNFENNRAIARNVSGFVGNLPSVLAASLLLVNAPF